MGPNGSGKSTLAHALAGHPGYQVLAGSVRLDGVELLTHVAHRARATRSLTGDATAAGGPGVRPFDLMVAAGVDPTNLRQRMRDEAQRVELRPEVLDRFVNVDLSGGERKRAEMVQFGLLRPKFAGARRDRLRTRRRRARCRGATAVARERRMGVRHPGDHALQATVARTHADGDSRVESGPRRRLGWTGNSPEILERDGYEPFRATTS